MSQQSQDNDDENAKAEFFLSKKIVGISHSVVDAWLTNRTYCDLEFTLIPSGAVALSVCQGFWARSAPGYTRGRP